MVLNGISGSQPADGSQSAQSQAKLEEDLNRFLNLLVTQLKNQDPLDPMKANEFTTQLVQFASVEQQIFQNSNLEKMLQLQEASQTANLVDYIGMTVEVDGKQLPLENGRAEFTYDIPAGAQKATITITNETGVTVVKRDADLDTGKHTFVWDGKADNGLSLPDGTYNVLVSGTDQRGELLQIPQTVYGRVTGASAEDGKTKLTLGDGVSADFADVLSVKETPAAPAPGG